MSVAQDQAQRGFSQAMVDRAVEMRKAGKSIHEIAASFKVRISFLREKLRPDRDSKRLKGSDVAAFWQDRGREPLPAGDEMSWGAITKGTWLDGVSFKECVK